MSFAAAYLSAETLRITDWERRALVRLVGLLSRGEVSLDMHSVRAPCIGGHVGRLSVEARRDTRPRADLRPPRNSSPSLDQLYYPGGVDDLGLVDLDHAGWHASPEIASEAITNFLATGRPFWDEVVSSSSSSFSMDRAA